MAKFEAGWAGGPGRPKGSRAKLGEAFLRALKADFAAGGVEAIQRMRTDDPSGYVKTIAGLLPKELTGEGGGPVLIVSGVCRPGELLEEPGED
jgi:hypothetical protein